MLLAFAGCAANAWGAPSPSGAQSPEATAGALLDRIAEGVWMGSDDYFHEGDYETTSRMGRLAIRLDPQNVEAVTTLAWLLRQRLQRPQQALAIYHRGLRDNPDSYEVPFDLGFTYYDLKQYPLAVHYLKQAIRPEAPPPVHHLLAHAYERLGRRDDALRVWRETIERFPQDLAARPNLERLEREMRGGSMDQSGAGSTPK